MIDASEVNNTYTMWNNETERAYYTNTCDKLYEIDLHNCIKCQDMCADSNHCAYIDNYCDNIVHALCDSTVWGDKANRDNFNRNFKWSTELSMFKQVARLKHREWVSDNKPKNESLHECMVDTRKPYKKATKKAKQAKSKQRSEFAEKLLDSNDCNFWKHWRKTKCKQKVIRDSNETEKLANGFVHNFGKKNIEFKDDKLLFDEFCGKYEEAAVQYSLSYVSDLGSFNVEEVENSVLELNTKRAGDLNGLSIEHILFAHPIIYMHLSMLFSLIVKHEHVPLKFKLNIIIPIIKDGKKKTTDVDNYRPITIISVISKIFEMCIFRQINCLFDYGGLLLGFVKGGGCEKSLFIVSNVVNYFLKHCSDLYIMTLDATAAFDKVNVRLWSIRKIFG